jgi:DNA-binding CsgD family transcriptional regulator
MRTLSENQRLVLKFLREGKTPAEISRLTGKRASTVSEAIRRGKGNIERAIQILQVAIENGLLDEIQAQKLKSILGKI